MTSRIPRTPNVFCGPSAFGNFARKSAAEALSRASACCSVTPGLSRAIAWK
jgi:hypothetical protein